MRRYPIILVAFGFVFVQAIRKKLPWMAAVPFAINLAANLIFTPIQFGLRNLPLAAIDIVIVWGTIIWMMVAFWKHHRWVAVAQVSYFVWLYTSIRESLRRRSCQVPCEEHSRCIHCFVEPHLSFKERMRCFGDDSDLCRDG